ncbi:hypothetical protein DWUX_454 [Desulfovibrio diazotrophicus]|nr:hypothetical protein DWUX_454 [Desulfovibrio diazotrophicus]
MFACRDIVHGCRNARQQEEHAVPCVVWGHIVLVNKKIVLCAENIRLKNYKQFLLF